MPKEGSTKKKKKPQPRNETILIEVGGADNKSAAMTTVEDEIGKGQAVSANFIEAIVDFIDELGVVKRLQKFTKIKMLDTDATAIKI